MPEQTLASNLGCTCNWVVLSNASSYHWC